MCNNILQYGHVYAWAREHGRRSISMRFCYKYPYFKICQAPLHNFFVYAMAKYAAKCGLLPVAAFHSPTGQSGAMYLMETRRNVLVEGWEVRFYDLFLKYREEITGLFSFNQLVREHVAAFMRQSETGRPVRLGIHIRRGDYQRWRGGIYYYEDTVYADYIRQFMSSCIGSPVVVYICGNDPALNRQYYIDSFPDAKVCFPEGNPGEDLCLLSECDFLIGAPSTFSLVAAMYHDIPLCWMMNRQVESNLPFQKFETLFRNIQ